METNSLRLLKIALPEDDRVIIRRTFSDIWRDITFISFETQAESLAFLYQQGQYAEEARPDVVFLDMREGEAQTLAFLKAVKDKPKLRNVPVITLANDADSLEHGDELAFYSHMVLARPLSRTQIRRLSQQLVDFWMGFQEFAVAE